MHGHFNIKHGMSVPGITINLAVGVCTGGGGGSRMCDGHYGTLCGAPPRKWRLKYDSHVKDCADGNEGIVSAQMTHQ